ncbi:hypothetical protein RclHR1_05070013 [Rhizophagus clarus]|uniref:Uncharacterized protein n=1 Tax=Rhizophagus clarus TaxID=94130 RepID=A0A2Z6SEB7_9GLOM|nr:hypothetical protein RclHR1_05070013 [Rhizophagus clarus]
MFYIKTVIPVLWREPWHNANYYNRNSLYTIITSSLSNDVKEFLTKKGIKTSDKSPAFDYLSFCKSIDIRIIDNIITTSSPLSEYNRFLLQEEIYSFLIKKCSEIKYLNIYDAFDLVYHPEAKISDDYDYTFLEYTLLDLHNLKVITIYSPLLLFNDDDFEEKLEIVAYRNLEILEVESINGYLQS